MANVMTASNQWATRPDDERYESLEALLAECRKVRTEGVERHIDLRDVKLLPDNSGGLTLTNRGQGGVKLTNWSFGQLCVRADAPASYLARIRPELAAECLHDSFKRLDDGTAVAKGLFAKDGSITLRALTGMRYNRVWDSEIVERAIDLTSMGWQVPPARPVHSGQRGTRKATTLDVLRYSATTSLGIKIGDDIAPAGLYRGDRDIFIFMVDESRPIMEQGAKAPKFRGFILRNSEVGNATLDLTCFLYDMVCGNHIIWGATQVNRIVARHIGESASRAFAEIKPALKLYSGGSDKDLLGQLTRARQTVIAPDRDKVIDLVYRKRVSPEITKRTLTDAIDTASRNVDKYGNPLSVWGVVSGMTEISQATGYGDHRHALDVAAGKLLTAFVGS